MSEDPAARGEAGAGRSRFGGDWRAIPPAAAPPPPMDVGGLPSIETIIHDPRAQAEVLARLQGRSGRRAGMARYALAGLGALALFAAVAVGGRYYDAWRSADPVVASSPAPPPVAAAPPPVAAAPPAVTRAVLPSPPAEPPTASPRPVATAPVRVDGGPAEAQPLLSEEWLRAHEALGLPPPKLVKTVKIVPPKAE